MDPVVDIIVVGATGYTGRCITRYLCTHPQQASFTLGFASRSSSKVFKLLPEIGKSSDDLQTFTIDVTDPASIRSVVRQARVVINAVGPYWLWGSAVVHACVRHGVHYVDLAGEVAWVKRVISEEDYAATKSGSIVVPACGLSSIPADILAFLSNKTLKGHVGHSASIDHSISAWKCENMIISGGSFHSVLTSIVDTPRKRLREAMQDFSLSPVVGVQYPRPRMLYEISSGNGPIYGVWNVMACMDVPIVQRSWGLFELVARRDRRGLEARDRFMDITSAIIDVGLPASCSIHIHPRVRSICPPAGDQADAKTRRGTPRTYA
ncbi:hypothetical protein BS17DRAFT_881183 [Gyrodon lividus]|nr:hypothetical protein BS17DRAFT_881183 [Gyrodon lividus]